MVQASIPVDLFNPGQVFACLGFLEAADVLLGDAEGGFDWSDEADVRFELCADGDENPFEVVLDFLAGAKILRYAPVGYTEPLSKKGTSADAVESKGAASSSDLRFSESYPDRKGDRMALPVRLEFGKGRAIEFGHWADGSSRNIFKLYSGNRSAHDIVCAMLSGTREKPRKKQSAGDIKALGIAALLEEKRDDLIAQPFDVLTFMGGSFNFDPRGAWTGLDAGYSPNEHKDHGVAASPIVELLAALGLEHARPDEYRPRQVCYGVWSRRLPPMLARPVLAGAIAAVPVRKFHFKLDLSGKNKVVTFSQEEAIQ
jgi:CRISPR-associated protein Csx14